MYQATFSNSSKAERKSEASRSGEIRHSTISSRVSPLTAFTAVNAVKGLTREEMVECLISPLRDASDFLSAFDELEKVAWYIHHTPEGRYYFDRQENQIGRA